MEGDGQDRIKMWTWGGGGEGPGNGCCRTGGVHGGKAREMSDVSRIVEPRSECQGATDSCLAISWSLARHQRLGGGACDLKASTNQPVSD